MKPQRSLSNLILAALFLALAYILPFFTGQIPKIGAMLCPMHIPVLLCGFCCGWPYGLAVGLVAPLFRSLILGAPPFFPKAVCMAFELAAYGAVSGAMHRLLPKRKQSVYASLLTAMLAGRLVWGAAMLVCMGISGSSFSFAAFLSGAFFTAIPGIITQLLLVPLLVMALDHAKRSESGRKPAA